MKTRGNCFIALEGIDGAGKTTCAKILSEKISGQYYKSGGQFFETIKSSIEELNNPQIRFAFYLTASLYASAEITKILTHHNVVCDRYIDSTIIYHRSLGANLEYVDANKIPILIPDFTFYLYASEEVAKQRLQQRNNKTPMDIIIEKNRVLQQKIHEEFLKHPSAIKINTSELTPEEVCSKILQTIEKR